MGSNGNWGVCSMVDETSAGGATAASLGVEDINFFNPEISECPYPAYEVLRDDAPVWQDPFTGMYVISRYEDIRKLLLDTEGYINGGERSARTPELTQRAVRIKELYESKGWLPARTLAGR